jgi:hypothetical protein
MLLTCIPIELASILPLFCQRSYNSLEIMKHMFCMPLNWNSQVIEGLPYLQIRETTPPQAL